jgi:D-amino-acid dehydrogenase
MIEQRGLLYAYFDRAAFEAEALAWRLRRDNGVVWTELEDEALRRFEPSLSPRYRFAAFVAAGAHCVDPGAYVRALVGHASGRGARIVRARATGLAIEAGELRAVLTDAGPVPCGRAVIAAGIGSVPLAASAGDKVVLASERGYHVEIADPAVAPRVPVMPSDGRMGNTPLHRGLRAAGQVELATVDAPPNWKRADILLKHLTRTFPGLEGAVEEDRVARWMGHRPSTPDGLPVIGPATGTPSIMHAFGHGHIGLATAPISGKIIADLVAGRRPPVPTEPYSAARFRRGR